MNTVLISWLAGWLVMIKEDVSSAGSRNVLLATVMVLCLVTGGAMKHNVNN